MAVISSVEWRLSDVLSNNPLRRRIDEVRWSTSGPSRFVPFRIPNHVQPHQKPSGKKSAAHMSLSPLPMYSFRLMYIPFVVSSLFHHLVASLAVVQ